MAEAVRRQQAEGANTLPAAKGKGLLRIALGAMTQPMFLLLLGAASVYALLGSLADAASLLLSVLAVGALSVYQEFRTERTLSALKSLASPRCTVVRDGRAMRIPSEEMVRGDRVVVDEGDRLAADAVLIEGTGLQVDESLLTGESEPVPKVPFQPNTNGPPGPAQSLHAGSLVVQGDGVALVTAVGANTALGRIGGSLARLTPRTSRLQDELRQIVQRLAVIALLTCLLAATLYAVRDGSWATGLLAGLTLAMALIPEEFAVVWTVMLALGAWRLARHQVLTRQPQAIEALGTVTVLCVDKTGTLTRNRMKLVGLHDGNAAHWMEAGACLSGSQHSTLQCAALASVPYGIEPMDKAIFEAAGGEELALQGRTAGPHSGIRQGKPYVSHWWTDPVRGTQAVHVKGAPEAVLSMCKADNAQTVDLLAEQAVEWSRSGLRVLAVAQAWAGAAPADGALPEGTRLHAVGLLAFMDPLREEVPRVVEECRDAGMRVVMITGDSPLTAANIARQAGLESDGHLRVMTGAEVTALNDLQLCQQVKDVHVFARVDPAQKLRIVRALQERGDVVAMTGDGVNDAPALRAADIGVAMGLRGTDVAREAASLVLLDDNFASLVAATKAGRRIFSNLQKALGYLFAVHVPIVGVSLLPILMGGPILLLPLHVVLLELLIDPACSLVFEAEPGEKDIMKKPPRAVTDRLFTARAACQALAIGGLALLAIGAVQWCARVSGAGPEGLRLASLCSILVTNVLMLAWFRRGSHRHAPANRAFRLLVLGVCVVLTILLCAPWVRAWFVLS